MFFKQLNQSSKPEHFGGHLFAVCFYYIRTWDPSFHIFHCSSVVSWSTLSWKWEIPDCKKDILFVVLETILSFHHIDSPEDAVQENFHLPQENHSPPCFCSVPQETVLCRPTTPPSSLPSCWGWQWIRSRTGWDRIGYVPLVKAFCMQFFSLGSKNFSLYLLLQTYSL